MTTSGGSRRLDRRTALKTLVALGVGTLGGTGAYGYLYERRRLEVTRARLPISGLPPSLSGLRVGLMTDIHHSLTVSRSDVDTAVAALLAERPQLIVLGGDYVSFRDSAFVDGVAESLGALTAPDGTFAVLGNHDDDRLMPAALARQGIEVLRDSRTRIQANGEALDLVGIGYWTRRARDLVRIIGRPTAPTILLAHDPRRIAEAAALDVSAVLSGHTHGGQIVLPGLGAVAARKFPTAAGLLRRDSTSLFVSRGVGTVYLPFRLNCPPEVAILTLERHAQL